LPAHLPSEWGRWMADSKEKTGTHQN